MSIIRQVFGTTRPRDVFRSMLTFEKLATKPIVHIVYWLGCGIFIIATLGVIGAAVGAAWREGLPMGPFLALPLLVVGLFSVFIGFLIWRAFCEFFMAVLSIAEDLRYMREAQERYENDARKPLSPQDPKAETAAEDPFFSRAANHLTE